MDDKLQILHGNLVKEGYDLPDIETFRKDMSDPVKSKKLHDSLTQEGYDLPDYDTFLGDMGQKKKDSSLLNIGQDTGLVSKESSEPITTPQSLLPQTPDLTLQTPDLGFKEETPETRVEKGLEGTLERAKSRNTTVEGDLGRALSSGSLRMLGGLGATPAHINRTLQNVILKPIAKAMGASDEEAAQVIDHVNSLNTFGQSVGLADEAQKTIDKEAEKIESRMWAIEGDIADNIGKGEWGKAGELLARGITQSIPYLALTGATAGGGSIATLSVIGATSATQQYSSLRDSGKSENRKILNSWLYGGFEAAGELVSAGLLRGIGKSFKVGLDGGYYKRVDPSFAKGAAKGIAKSFGLESSSEAVTQIGQNFSDIITGIDPNKNIFSGVIDAFLIGGFSGVGMGSAQSVAYGIGRAMASDKEVNQVQENVVQQQILTEQAEETDSDPVKKALLKSVKDLRFQANEVMDGNYKIAQELSPQQKEQVAELYSVWNDLQAQIDEGRIPPDRVPTIEKAIQGVKDQIQGIKEEVVKQIEEREKEKEKTKGGTETKASKTTTKPKVVEKNVPEIKEENTAKTYGKVAIPEGDVKETIGGKVETIKRDIQVEGKNAGTVNLQNELGVSQIRDIHLDKEVQGKGHGKDAYRTLRDDARSRGEELISDISYRQTQYSKNVWESLVRSGEAEKVGDFYVFKDAPNKEALVEKATNLEILRSAKGIKEVNIASPDKLIQVTQDAKNLTREEFMEKYKDDTEINSDLKGNLRELIKARVFLDTVDKTGKNDQESLDLLEKVNTFVSDNQLEESYGSTRDIIERLKVAYARGKGEGEGTTVQEATGDGGRGQTRTQGQQIEGEGVEKTPVVQPNVQPTSEIPQTNPDIGSNEEAIPPSDSKTPPNTNPPYIEGISEAGGEKRKMEIARKAVEESMLLSEDTKSDIRNEGIEYTVQKDILLDEEVEELVKIYGTDSKGLDDMQALVMKENQKMSGDRRNWLTALLITERAKQIESAPDFETRVSEKKKLTDLIIFTAEQGVLSGRETRSFKKIGEALQLYPDAIKASIVAKIDQKNKEFFDSNGLEKMIKQEVEEYFKTHEPKVSQEYTPDIAVSKARITKIREERSEILSKLKESFRKPSSSLSSSIIPLSAEQVELVFKLVGSYIEEGFLRTEAVVRKFRQDWESITDEKISDKDALEMMPSDKINGKTLKEWDLEAREKKATKQKKPKEKKIPTEEELVGRLLNKAGKIATRKQLENFVKKYLTEIKEKGILSDQEFRSVLAEVLGRDYISGKSEEKIDKAAQAVANYNGKLGELDKAFSDWKEAYDQDPNSPDLAEKRKALNDTLKQTDKALSDAKRKYQFVQEMLREDADFVERLGSMVQGGLLIPSSQIANIAGNVLLLPETGPAYMVSGMFDALTSKAGEGMNSIISKVDPQKYPWLYRQLNKWSPSERRTIMPFEYARGYKRGYGDNFIEGFKQTFSVEGPVGTELMKGQVQRGIHPIDALMHLYKTATREEQRSFSQVAGDLMEALPAGWFANAHFRGLNMFDLPFRGAGQSAILYEAFGIKWAEKIKQAEQIKDPEKRKARLQQLKETKEVEREQFYRNPSKDALDLAKRQGAKNTFSQSTAISSAINSFEKFAKEHKDTPYASVANNVIRILKVLNAPYVTVPINIMSRSLEMSIPVFPATKMINHVVKAANAKGKGLYSTADTYRRMAMEDFGNAAVASVLSSIAVSLAMAGIIAWGDDDRKVRAAQQEAGKEGLRVNSDALWRWLNGEDTDWQEGDDTYTLRRLGILSVRLGSIAQAVGEMTPEEIEAIRDMGVMEKQSWLGQSMMKHAIPISLDQSIMTGVNTFVTGLMGSEADKDRWVVNMSAALSTVVYPNTLSNASQSFDGYFRETRDYSIPKEQSKIISQLKNTMKDKMFMSKDLPAKVTIWGESIKRIPEGENPFLYGILGIAKHKRYQKYSFGTKLYEFFEKYRQTNPDEASDVFPSLPTGRTKVGWDDANMTPDQVEQYQMRVGQLRAQEAETYFNSQEWEDVTDDERIEQLRRIYSKGTKKAEAELFSWLKYKTREPEKWKVLVDNDAVPMPRMSKKMGEYKLDKPDIEMLNNIAFGLYADAVKGMFEGNTKENIDALKKAKDDETGESEYLKELNLIWRGAFNDAKDIMEVELSKIASNK